MPILVMKFGGTSVATLDRIRRAAKRVGREVANGYDVIVIVSAMSGKTNELVGWVEETSPFFDAREYDAVVVLGRAGHGRADGADLAGNGYPGAQLAGLAGAAARPPRAHAAARIEEIPTDNINAKFAEGMKVAVVAGFQGISPEGRITTLGRGGSDTTAVAFAAAFGAERCDIYTDVDGVYTTDPRIDGQGAQAGPDRVRGNAGTGLARAPRCCRPARSNWRCATRCKLRVLSQFRGQSDDSAGTLVCDEEDIMESNVVAGVAYCRDEAKMTLISVADRPGIAAAIFGPLAEAGVNVDMIVQNISEEGRTDMTFSCPIDQVARAEKAMHGGQGRRRDQLSRSGRRHGRGQGLGRRHRHAQPRRCRGQDVQGAARRGHQHQGHHHLRDQDLGADRPEVHGTGRAGAARRVRAGQGA